MNKLAEVCGVSDCNKQAICGLKNKENPNFIINVCYEHFIKIMQREPAESEIGLGQTVMELDV